MEPAAGQAPKGRQEVVEHSKGHRKPLGLGEPEDKKDQRAYKKAVRSAKTESWWRYCQEIESIPEAARIQKILRKDPMPADGSLRTSTGEFTESWREEIEVMLGKHVPGWTGLDDSSRHCHHGQGLVGDRWIEPYKAAGTDGIFPALLQQGLEVILPPVTKLLRACVTLGYIPQQWRITRVVFIPKPGRIVYDQAGEYRPISLTSFLLETLERLIDKHVRDGLLRIRLLRTLQFTYQADKSTETALHRLVHRLEDARKKDCLAVGLFLDIEGAFNCTTVKAICRAAGRHGLEPTVIRWVRNMLSTRLLTVYT